MTTPLINFLKEELNFASTAFIIKKKIGKNTFGTERYFKFVGETENEVVVPRGFIGKLIRFCRENKIGHDFIDERKKQKLIPYLFNCNPSELCLDMVVNVFQHIDINYLCAFDSSIHVYCILFCFLVWII